MHIYIYTYSMKCSLKHVNTLSCTMCYFALPNQSLVPDWTVSLCHDVIERFELCHMPYWDSVFFQINRIPLWHMGYGICIARSVKF